MYKAHTHGGPSGLAGLRGVEASCPVGMAGSEPSRLSEANALYISRSASQCKTGEYLVSSDHPEYLVPSGQKHLTNHHFATGSSRLW